MPLFLTQAHLLRARIALAGQGDSRRPRQSRSAAAALIGKHGYGRGAVELAVLDAEIACAANARTRRSRHRRSTHGHRRRTLPRRAHRPDHLRRLVRPAAAPRSDPAARATRASPSSKPPATPTTPSATIISARPSPRMWRATTPPTTPSPPTSPGVEAGGSPPSLCLSPRGERGPWNCPPTLTKGHGGLPLPLGRGLG